MGHEDRNVSPNVFGILWKGVPDQTIYSSINASLSQKGINAAGSTSVRESPYPDAERSGNRLTVYFTYLLAAEEDILDRQYALLLSRVAKIFRWQGVHGCLLSQPRLSQLLMSPEVKGIYATACRGDRDLKLGEDETLVTDMSRNKVRSSVWLVRRDQMHLVRKAYSSACAKHVENETSAREAFSDPRVVEIYERRGNVLYLPHIEGDEAWKGGPFEFCRRDRAAIVFDFLTLIARSGHSMIDIDPSAFLFDRNNQLKVVDFEFFNATPPAKEFALSKDYSGAFDGLPAPAKNGYRRYWYDALGGDLHAVMSASPGRYAVRRIFHIFSYRIPRRSAKALERMVRQAHAQIVRLLGLRSGRFRI